MSQPATETAPPPGRRAGGGSFLSRASVMGIPNWLLITLGAALVGTGFILVRNHEKSAAAAQAAATTATATTTTCQDANGNVVPCNSLLAINSEGQGEYEQITSQLTGLSGQNAALASSIGQLQGQNSGTSTGTPTGQGTSTSVGTASPPVPIANLIGESTPAAISQILAAGAKVNAVYNGQGQGLNPSLYASTHVVQAGYFGPGAGQAGQNQANSYDLQVA